MNIDYVKEYACGAAASNEILEWCDTVLAAAIRKGQASDETEAEHIVDYLLSDAAPKRLRKMSYVQAREGADKWTKSQQKKGKNLVDLEGKDIRVIHDFLDGNRIVQLLTERAYRREGFLMAHCVGSYSPESSTIYSYRDQENLPHATFEVIRGGGGEITQLKGKGNGPIHPKYIQPILTFLQFLDIDIRSQEMRNLGYVHVDEKTRELIEQFEWKEDIEFIPILGEDYIYEGTQR